MTALIQSWLSQNIGHNCEITTVGSYLKVSQERQAELMRGIG